MKDVSTDHNFDSRDAVMFVKQRPRRNELVGIKIFLIFFEGKILGASQGGKGRTPQVSSARYF